MNTSERKKIVEILETDKDLLLNWRRFYDELGLKIADCIRLNKQIKTDTMTHYELFSEILSLWVSANSELNSHNLVQKLIGILKKNGFNLVAGELEKAFGVSSRTDKELPIYYDVGEPRKNFVGRTKELEKLKELYNAAKELVVIITGMSRIGKSELAKNFAKQIAVDAVDCIWLNGESRENLKNSIKQFEIFLKLPNPYENEPLMTVDVRFARIISAIRGNTRILVIIDHVEETNEDVQKIISIITKGRCFFLVTSTKPRILNYIVTVIQLEILSEKEAVNLLRTSGISELGDEIKKLGALLKNFHHLLALHQTVAFIKIRKLSNFQDESHQISDFMNIYQRKKRTLLDHKVNLIKKEDSETALITWSIVLENLQMYGTLGDLAIQLLNTIAYFEPDGTQMEFLNLFKKSFVETIPLLKTYSLVKVENGIISIHRLIQQVIRLHLSSQHMDTQLLMQIISTGQPILESTERWVGLRGDFGVNIFLNDDLNKIYFDATQLRRYTLRHIMDGMRHIVSVWKQAAQNPQLIDDFQNNLIDALNNLRYFRFYQHIVDLCHAALKQINTALGTNSKFILRVKSELAFAQCMLDDKFNESDINELKAVYAKQLSVLGEEDESTLTTAHYITQIQYYHRYKFCAKIKAENLQWCRKVVELKAKVFGPLHKSTLSTKLILVEYTSNNNESANLYEECYNWQVTHLVAHRKDTGEIFESYVHCLVWTEKYEQAKCVLEDFLQLKLTQYEVLANRQLSLVLFCLGETEKAFSALRKSISSRNHHNISKFDSTRSLHKIADSLLKDGNYSKALELFRKLQNKERVYEWWWVDVEYKISQCLVGLNRFEEARDTLQKLSSWPRANSRPIVKINKLLKDINEQIAATQAEPIQNTDF